MVVMDEIESYHGADFTNIFTDELKSEMKQAGRSN